MDGSSRKRPSARASIIVIAVMLLFGGSFVGLATWLGKQDRHRYRIEPPPPLPPRETRLREALGLHRPVLPRGADLPHEAAALAALEARLRAEDSLDARFDLALLLLVRGEAAEVPDLIEGLLPDRDAATLRAVALEWLRAAQEDRRSAWQEVRRLARDDVDASIRLGRLALEAGDARRAVSEAESALSGAPLWADAHLLLGEACLLLQDIGRAKQAFRSVLDLRPGDAAALAGIRRIDG